MGRGGTGLSSSASAWRGAAVTRNKDKHIIAAGSLPSIALSPQVRRQFALPMRLIETTAELGRSSAELRLLVKLPDFCTTRAADCGQHRCTHSHNSAQYFAAVVHSRCPARLPAGSIGLNRVLRSARFCRRRLALYSGLPPFMGISSARNSDGTVGVAAIEVGLLLFGEWEGRIPLSRVW